MVLQLAGNSFPILGTRLASFVYPGLLYIVGIGGINVLLLYHELFTLRPGLYFGTHNHVF